MYSPPIHVQCRSTCKFATVFLNLIILAWTVLKFCRFSSLGVLRRGVLRRPILLYPADKMRRVWLCPYGSFHGILESSEQQRQQLPAQPWRSSSLKFKRRTWRSPRSNRVSGTCKGSRTKTGSAGGENLRRC